MGLSRILGRCEQLFAIVEVGIPRSESQNIARAVVNQTWSCAVDSITDSTVLANFTKEARFHLECGLLVEDIWVLG